MLPSRAEITVCSEASFLFSWLSLWEAIFLTFKSEVELQAAIKHSTQTASMAMSSSCLSKASCSLARVSFSSSGITWISA